MAIEYNKINYSEKFIGTVVDLNLETRECAVFIPKLMPTLYQNAKLSKEEFTNNGLVLPEFKSKMASKVKKVNYIWAKPTDATDPIPAIGSSISVTFVEGNPEYPIWFAFNPFNNSDYYIEEERKSHLFDLNLNLKKVILNTEDELNISINDHNIEYDENNNRYNIISEYERKNNKKPSEAIEELKQNFEKLKDFFITFMKDNIVEKINPNIATEFIYIDEENGIDHPKIYSNFLTHINTLIDKYQTFESLMDNYSLANNKILLINELFNTYLNNIVNIDDDVQKIDYKNIFINFVSLLITTSNEELSELKQKTLEKLNLECKLYVYNNTYTAAGEYVFNKYSGQEISFSTSGSISLTINGETYNVNDSKYIISGWYYDKELKKLANTSDLIKIHSTTSLYAKWQVKPVV